MNSKPWYQSTTIIASIVTGIVAISSVFKINIGDLAPDIQTGLEALGVVVGVGVTIYGRIVAKTVITK